MYGTVSTQKNAFLTNNERTLRREVAVALIFWSAFVLWVICFKFCNTQILTTNYCNLSELTLTERFLYDIVPFRTRQNHTEQWLEFFANSLIFAPYGVLLNYLFKKRNIFRDVALCFLLSLSVEVFQLYTMLGGFATVDLIMNTLGYFVGLVFYYLLFKKRSVRTCVWICRVFNLLLLPVVAYVVYTTVQNWQLIVDIATQQLPL
jgi:glycopeptide antibiotics resistance protein